MFSTSIDTFTSFCSTFTNLDESVFQDVATYYWQEIGYLPTVRDFYVTNNNGRNLSEEKVVNSPFQAEQEEIALKIGNPYENVEEDFRVEQTSNMIDYSPEAIAFR